MERIKKLFSKGNYKAFFDMIKMSKMSLITVKESKSSSDVTEKQAKDVSSSIY
jgi:hypothetical protein